MKKATIFVYNTRYPRWEITEPFINDSEVVSFTRNLYTEHKTIESIEEEVKNYCSDVAFEYQTIYVTYGEKEKYIHKVDREEAKKELDKYIARINKEANIEDANRAINMTIELATAISKVIPDSTKFQEMINEIKEIQNKF